MKQHSSYKQKQKSAYDDCHRVCPFAPIPEDFMDYHQPNDNIWSKKTIRQAHLNYMLWTYHRASLDVTVVTYELYLRTI